MEKYNHKKIEKKWQENWIEKDIYKTEENSKKPKSYVLDMFPYPSGDGLHVGHLKGYIATDIYSRYKKMSGYSVLHPMGWDAFGLPAENFAIKNKIHPRVAVEKNIKKFKKQLSVLGFDYDWKREINTTNPEYYKWTQWIFLKMFEKGLAYESYEPINWCPKCKTGLANEDLEGDKCERCGTKIEQKPMRQWVLKITDYADRMLKDLDELNWPESIKESQKDWIGRSEGAEIDFKIKNTKLSIKVFTTRPDTLFGAMYCVLAPEHKLIQELKKNIENWDELARYTALVKGKSDMERTADGKDKTGVELKGLKAINPANGEEIPIFIADYVLAHYGTGAIMAVPAHDSRDFEFAKKFDLPIREVILPERIDKRNNDEEAYVGDGVLVNSGEFDEMNNEKAKDVITKFVGGKMKTTYKLRDWVFSRQRYWGEPIPIIHCEKCGVVPVPEKDLPVILPDVKSYEPTGTGESPLANISEWVNVDCPKCGGKGKRETNTMPQWAGSSWYYLRYIDPHDNKVLVDKDKEKYWSPVDMYVGGAEHATRHLIYARFWHKFLYDLEVINHKEPFKRLQYVGLIIAEDGRKMSKRYGNVVNPDDVAEIYGADTLRIYEMFMGPFDQSIKWSSDSIIGSRKFLEKIWGYIDEWISFTENGKEIKNINNKEINFLFHKTIKKVGEDIESFDFNTAISQMMILVNKIREERGNTSENKVVTKYQIELLVKLIAPFAPHISEELWKKLGHNNSIHTEQWPKYDENNIVEDIVTIAIQIDGKIRGSFKINVGTEDEEIKKEAMSLDVVKKWIKDKKISKTIYIKNRLISIVTN